MAGRPETTGRAAPASPQGRQGEGMGIAAAAGGATAIAAASYLQFVLLGLATGALTALVALGIVLVYKSSRVINFASGALGGVAAYACYFLRSDGLPAALCIVIGMLLGALLGVLTWGVLHLLRGAALIVRLVATLALFSMGEAFMTLKWGPNPVLPAPFLPAQNVPLFDHTTIGLDRLILIGLALLLAVALRVLYGKSRFGLVTAAVAESRDTAAGAGICAARVEVVNFAVAGALSALAAICLAPIVSLSASVLAVTVIPALAACVVGRFSSFGITVAAALAIGIAQDELLLTQPSIASALGVNDASLAGLAQVVPLAILLVYMIVSGRSRLQRGETLARLPSVGDGRIPVLPGLAGVALAVALLVGAGPWTTGLTTTFAVAIVIQSVIVLTGYAGQLSLGQFALAGFGAWVAARLVSVNGFPFSAALAVAVLVTMVLGAIVALPALRTRGTNLAVATLAIALMLSALIFTNPSLTGGFTGLPVHGLRVLGISIDPITHGRMYGGMTLVLLVLCGLLVANIRRGAVGSRMLAVRGNERAAAALGIRVTEVKVYAFALSAAIAAVGGVCLAFQEPNIDVTQFGVVLSILIIQFAVIGGIGWGSGVTVGALGAPGGLLAAILTQLVPGGFDITDWLAVVAGSVLIIVLRTAPDGMAAVYSRVLGRHLNPWRLGHDARLAGPAAALTGHPRRPARLVVDAVTVRFGGLTALDRVSLAVNPGEIVGLIGPNGAGKTTLLDAATGFTVPQAGRILLDGTDLTRWSPERRARRGVLRSWQAVELFEDLSVWDNLLAGTDAGSKLPYLTDLVRPGRRRPAGLMLGIVREFRLDPFLGSRPSELPQGTSRLVGIARAMTANPAILLLDEPAAGLDEHESAELGAAIRDIAGNRGIGVLVIEHDVPFLTRISDRMIALDFGSVVAHGSPREVIEHPEVVASYLGEAIMTAGDVRQPTPGGFEE
jgi:ABC-type branched-subunit amino acid transport system ATPase component/branched-subunit amino acid ABC-type transport system permease component